MTIRRLRFPPGRSVARHSSEPEGKYRARQISPRTTHPPLLRGSVTNDGRVVPLRLDSRVHWRAWVSRAELANWWPCMSLLKALW